MFLNQKVEFAVQDVDVEVESNFISFAFRSAIPRRSRGIVAVQAPARAPARSSAHNRHHHPLTRRKRL